MTRDEDLSPAERELVDESRELLRGTPFERARRAFERILDEPRALEVLARAMGEEFECAYDWSLDNGRDRWGVISLDAPPEVVLAVRRFLYQRFDERITVLRLNLPPKKW